MAIEVGLRAVKLTQVATRRTVYVDQEFRRMKAFFAVVEFSLAYVSRNREIIFPNVDSRVLQKESNG